MAIEKQLDLTPKVVAIRVRAPGEKTLSGHFERYAKEASDGNHVEARVVPYIYWPCPGNIDCRHWENEQVWSL